MVAMVVRHYECIVQRPLSSTLKNSQDEKYVFYHNGKKTNHHMPRNPSFPGSSSLYLFPVYTLMESQSRTPCGPPKLHRNL